MVKNSWYFCKVKCQYCKNHCIKYGKQNSIQRYRCKQCQSVQLEIYKNKAWLPESKELFIRGLGCSISIRRMVYLIKVSKPTLLKWLREGKKFKEPDRDLILANDEYEIDEMKTFVGNKKNESWITYAISRTTRQVIALKVGRRTKENIKTVVEKVLLLNPKTIYTDKLNIYPLLIPQSIHKRGRRKTNKIERKNLTLREHIKRLCRKSISYTKKEEMLEYHLRWYFWG